MKIVKLYLLTYCCCSVYDFGKVHADYPNQKVQVEHIQLYKESQKIPVYSPSL